MDLLRVYVIFNRDHEVASPWYEHLLDKISVFGGLDHVLNGLVKLRPDQQDASATPGRSSLCEPLG